MGAATSLLRRAVDSGREVWRLDNGLVRADILPGFGGRVWTLTDVARGVDWVWKSPKVALAVPAPGASYDDSWAGGWEELFPNDAPGDFDGRTLPDHGEWWSRAWTADVLEDTAHRAEVRLRLETRSAKASCEKIVGLDAGARSLRVRYRIENREKTPLRFMLKQHLAAAVRPGDRLELPGGTVHRVDPSFSTLVKASPAPWPAEFVLPPAGKDKEFVYVADLPEGWAGIRRPDGAALRMSFDLKAFPHCWFFMDLGGWRGHYTVVVEPCTNWPKDLAEAAAAGRCAVLPPGGVFETAVEAALS
ncbi:MAG: hypothetical protein HYV14_06405 [Elusimicrobia bacterium]|nr:hypothetical protein [Elusimicrobiota bacterium]